MDTQKFLRSLRRYVRMNFPGCEAESIVIRFRSGEAMRMPVIGKTPASILTGAQEQLADNELQVLAHVPDTDKPGATPEKLAKESGYRLNTWFRNILRNLRKKKKIRLDPDGYRKER